MNWKRYKLLIIAGGICGLLSILFVVWMFNSRSSTAESTASINSLRGRQTQLTQGEDFPSRETHLRLVAEKEQLQETRAAFESTVRDGQAAPPQMTRARFNDYLRNEILPPMRAAAAASTRGGEHGVILGDPDFGMRTFLDGQLPESAELPSLMLFLELMRHYSLLMFDAGISELVSFQRVTPDASRPGAPRPAPTAPGGPSPFVQPQPGAPLRPGQPAPPAEDPVVVRRRELFDQVHLRVHVRVYEDMLWDMLNRLVEDSNQAVVRNLRLTNTNEQIWPPYLTRPGARPGTTTPARRPERPRSEIERRLSLLEVMGTETSEATPEPAAIPGLAERRQRAAGGELLDVTFDLIIYRLKPAAQGA